MKNKKGKLIVIDGTDGSGKATQVKLLAQTLKNEGYMVKIVDFPEYYKNFFGGFIAHCLQEQYYNWTGIHPKIASIAYAADRWESKSKMEEWLKRGYIVIANRYVSANQIHQGGKIKDPKKRAEFIDWLDTMEHKVFKIPRPNVVVYLALPISVTQKLIESRIKSGVKRAYLRRKKDLVEYDLNYLENSRKSALWLSKVLPYFKKIDCSRKGEILSREAIHEMVYKEAKKVLK
jgi:dTMP kinase